ncbi:purine-binding chemotaxis protein CheW [Thermolongibacillus altinsuensis]|uniref:Purine-binding chemotaxis protein CheW n=1 Tax=Thermolongibacillus altinsuensis TaxID=575256 RepID=A0A4R1QJA8_9BACL|nr:chemotaxis protein CheW [Thermolongibacillus altinsuensis]TCL51100.1 purine-binding chemotaxis protein CheW [Thermolongibacillus altinsuensis]
MEQNIKCVVIKLHNEQFGIDIHQVRSIERLKSITAIPQTPHYVKGIVNLRGNVIPVIDLCKRLSMKSSSYTDQTRLVVVTVKETDVGLIVDAANEVMDINGEQIQPTPTITQDKKIDFLYGIAKLENQILILLDVEKLLSNDDVIHLEQLKELKENLRMEDE